MPKQNQMHGQEYARNWKTNNSNKIIHKEIEGEKNHIQMNATPFCRLWFSMINSKNFSLSNILKEGRAHNFSWIFINTLDKYITYILSNDHTTTILWEL